MIFPAELVQQAADLIAAARARDVLIATAESCTGGLIAGLLTEIAGSSAVVDRGFVTYSYESKEEMLGVSHDLLQKDGAVNEETARQMAAGALAHSRAGIVVAVTGIAGPGGGTAEKPVGLVHIAAARRGGTVLHRECRFGDIGRDKVRLATVAAALEMLRAQL